MAVQAQNKIKGNPAHNRMGNPRNKVYRLSLRVAQENRKQARRVDQLRRESINKARGFTGWEAAKAKRAEARG